jgi:hypothetical protein
VCAKAQVGWLPDITIPHENQDVLFSSISKRIDYEIFILAMKSSVSNWANESPGCCVTLVAFAIFTLKSMYLKAKEEELWKLKYLTIQNILFKKSSKRNQNPSRYYNSMTILKFQHKPKIPSFKNPQIKTNLLLLHRDQNPLRYYYTL